MASAWSAQSAGERNERMKDASCPQDADGNNKNLKANRPRKRVNVNVNKCWRTCTYRQEESTR